MKQCLEKGTELAQTIADALFNLPATEDVDGPMVTLPAPSTRLPRQKHVKPYLYFSLFIFFLCNGCRIWNFFVVTYVHIFIIMIRTFLGVKGVFFSFSSVLFNANKL